MLKLIQNEWMKLWAKKGTWVILGLLLLLVIVPASLFKYYDAKEKTDGPWQDYVKEQIQNNEEIIADEEIVDEDFKQHFIEENQKLQYRLDNDLELSPTITIDRVISDAVTYTMFITLFTIIVAASIVSIEFSTGTIKMLLTRPVSRAKILTSKLITVFLFGFFLIAINLVVSSIIGFIFYGTTANVQLELVDGAIVEVNVWKDLAYTQLLSLGDFVMSILFAFLVGSVFRSSSIAIGFSFFMSFMAGTVVMLFSRYEFVKYIWITHTDLTQHKTGNKIVEGITMPFSLTVLAIYAVLFIVVSYISFTKRDVTA